jgi:tetraacyldisaccharide-1-P 4'-kinase
VCPDDPIDEVGDEALVAAAELHGSGVPVFVGPSRGAALELAARAADVVVLDGVAQIAPARAALALLAVQADEPWGRSGAAPPAGDRRAPVSCLLAACDAVVPLGPEGAALEPSVARPVWPARLESRGAWVEGAGCLTWQALRSRRVGLFCALGRPERLLRALLRQGVTPRVVVRVRDHGPFDSAARARMEAARGVELWLATRKCALHLRRPGRGREVSALALGAPVARLDGSLVLGLPLCARLRAVWAS